MLLDLVGAMAFCAAMATAAADPGTATIQGAPATGAPRMEALPQSGGVAFRNCRIVAPHSAALTAPSQELLALVRQRGGTAEIVAPAAIMDKDELQWRVRENETLILVGSILSNRALIPLYAAYVDFTDAYHPGGDGYVIRTVLDFPGGTNVIVLGGSSDAGVARAIGRACEIVAALKPGEPFPLLCEIKLGGDAQAAIGPAADLRVPFAGYLYGLTGEQKFAEAVKGELLQPRGGDYYDADDYNLEPLLRSWTIACDSSVVSASDVQAVQQFFLNTLIHNQDAYWRARDGQSIGSRHHTMGTSAFHAIVAYLLRRGNPNPAAAELLRRWKAECDAYFTNAVTTFHDDLEDLTSYHSVQPIANFALEQGIAGYFHPPGRSCLDRAILRAFASVDNMGHYCGAGTYEEARPGQVNVGIMFGYPLAMAACVKRDRHAAWLLQHFRGTGVSTWGVLAAYGGHTFTAGDSVPAVEPRHLLGVLTTPLGEYRYARLPQSGDSAAQSALPPYDRTFEKLCFRDRFAPQGQYLVLQGYQHADANNVRPCDANSIIRYTDAGVPWLIANTERQGNFHRNAVFISDGETSSTGDAVCELIGRANAGDAHLVGSRLNNYHSATWDRWLVWLRGRAFALIDSVRFDKPGKRQVLCTFRSAPPAELLAPGGREWVARSGKAELHLLNADQMPMTSRRDGSDGAAIPTILRQWQAADADAGDMAVFRNLWYVTAPDRPRRYEIRPLGQSAMLIRDVQTPDAVPALFAVRTQEASWSAGPFQSDAAAIYVGADGSCRIAGTRITFEGRELPSGPATEHMRDALCRLWEDALPIDSPAASPHEAAGKKKTDFAWQFDGLEPRRPAILAPIVSASEPPQAGALENLVDGFIPLWTGDANWENKAGVTLTFDLRRSEQISAIELATGLVSPMNELPAPAGQSDIAATVEYSDDEFQNDVRGGPTRFKPGFTIEPLHKGTVFPMGRWRLAVADQSARYVRIRFPPGAIAFREVFIRRASGTESRFGPSLTADLDGDGAEEAVVTTDACELVVLGSNGQKRWSRKFLGPVTCLKAARLKPGGRTCLLVGTWEARIYCFASDGRELWVTDLLPLGGDLPTPFSIALCAPEADGGHNILVGNYARVSFLSADGKLLGHSFASGAFETMALALDPMGDAAQQALLYNVWGPISVVDRAKREVVRTIGSPTGEGLALEALPGDAAGGPRVLVATDSGLGVFRADTGEYDWQRPLAPLTTVTLADLDGDGLQEIIAGKRDGWLLALSADGQVKHKALIGDEVRSVAQSPANPGSLWIATASDIRRLDERLYERARFDIKAQRIAPLGNDLLLVLGEDGSVAAFQPDK
jgi:hypothetical protein